MEFYSLGNFVFDFFFFIIIYSNFKIFFFLNNLII